MTEHQAEMFILDTLESLLTHVDTLMDKHIENAKQIRELTREIELLKSRG